MPLVLEMEEENIPVTPCFSSEGINYMHIRHNNLYCEYMPRNRRRDAARLTRLISTVLALSKRNSNAVEIILFLHRLAGVSVIVTSSSDPTG